VTQRHLAERRLGEERAMVHESLSIWSLRVPQLRATWDALRHTFDHSVADLAALRMRGDNEERYPLPAAGAPWFMTVFGRDTIITSLQTLLFGPRLAIGALDALAQLQATVDDPSIDLPRRSRHGGRGKAGSADLGLNGRGHPGDDGSGHVHGTSPGPRLGTRLSEVRGLAG
jgi:glycogen debranching enzyme